MYSPSHFLNWTTVSLFDFSVSYIYVLVVGIAIEYWFKIRSIKLESIFKRFSCMLTKSMTMKTCAKLSGHISISIESL